MSNTITLEVEDLTTLVATMVSEALKPLLVQQPQAEAPAKRSAKASTKSKTRASKASTSKTRSAKPVSAAQHAKGSVIEIVFGIRADGSLTEHQQSRARQFFAEHDVTFGPQPITMRSIVQGIRSVNHTLRADNESTVRYWAVWNGPKGTGRLTDRQARELLRSSK